MLVDQALEAKNSNRVESAFSPSETPAPASFRATATSSSFSFFSLSISSFIFYFISCLSATRCSISYFCFSSCDSSFAKEGCLSILAKVVLKRATSFCCFLHGGRVTLRCESGGGFPLTAASPASLPSPAVPSSTATASCSSGWPSHTADYGSSRSSARSPYSSSTATESISSPAPIAPLSHARVPA